MYKLKKNGVPIIGYRKWRGFQPVDSIEIDRDDTLVLANLYIGKDLPFTGLIRFIVHSLGYEMYFSVKLTDFVIVYEADIEKYYEEAFVITFNNKED